jgi:hypothetical protein
MRALQLVKARVALEQNMFDFSQFTPSYSGGPFKIAGVEFDVKHWETHNARAQLSKQLTIDLMAYGGIVVFDTHHESITKSFPGSSVPYNKVESFIREWKEKAERIEKLSEQFKALKSFKLRSEVDDIPPGLYERDTAYGVTSYIYKPPGQKYIGGYEIDFDLFRENISAGLIRTSVGNSIAVPFDIVRIDAASDLVRLLQYQLDRRAP